MMDEFMTQMFKKLVGAALGAVGSKLGGQLGSLVLNYLGLGSQSAEEIAAEMRLIESEVKDIDANLHKLINQTNYDFATKDFANYTAVLETASSDIRTYLSDKNLTDAEKQADIKKYLLNMGSDFANLDVYLTAIDNAMTGQSNAILGHPDKPLMKLFIDTYWDSLVASEDLTKTYNKIVDAYKSAVLFQLRASSLSHSYHLANNDSILAQKVINTFTTRIVEQYKLMIEAMPVLVALCGIDTPCLRVSADNFSFEYPPGSDEFTYIQIKDYYLDDSKYLTDSASPHNVTLQRAWKSGKAAGYFMNIDFFYQGIRQSESVLLYSDSFGPRTFNHSAQIEAMVPTMVSKLPAGGRTPLSIVPTMTQNRYMLRAADGTQVGLSNYQDAGNWVTFRKELASGAGQIVSFAGLRTVPKTYPAPENAKVSAWSQAYASGDANLGRWAKGFRVRYRLILVNRFGKSEKSPWIQCANGSQDANGYFNGMGKYYLPQIQISPSEAELAESFQLFRQFENEAEEEISYSLTPAEGPDKPPILIDEY
jgi:hypothetical protein